MGKFSRIIAIWILIAPLFSIQSQASIAAPVTWQAKVDPWVSETAANGQTEFLLPMLKR